ncbi:MAG: methylaspartate mutase subunit S [Deltaproteobacteria bacterium]|nr:methylaspartate mutase subunit S [Deltaproteobacteria bacterium]
MNEGAETKGTLVTGVIGEDVHIIGVRILEHVLRQAGFKTVPLGAQVSQEEFVEAAIETNADAILVSSLGGHASLLLPGLRGKCQEAGLSDILLYLGGQLVLGESDWSDSEKAFRAMGIDRVYPPNVHLARVVQDLEGDCSARRSARGADQQNPEGLQP